MRVHDTNTPKVQCECVAASKRYFFTRQYSRVSGEKPDILFHYLLFKKLNCGYLPVPASLTVMVPFFGALETIESVALIAPVEAGVKVAFTAQELPLGTTEHEFVCANEAESVPPRVIDVMLRSDNPVFFMVILFVSDGAPTAILPKFSDLDETDSTGGAALAASFTETSSLFGSLELIASTAVLDPKVVEEGVAVT